MNGPLVLAAPVAARRWRDHVHLAVLPAAHRRLPDRHGMSGADAEGPGPGAASLRADGDDAAAGPHQTGAGTVTIPRNTTGARAASSGTTAGTPARGRAVAGTALFVLGFSALFATYGAPFGGLCQALLAHQQELIRSAG